jgi:hypothetical protein
VEQLRVEVVVLDDQYRLFHVFRPCINRRAAKNGGPRLKLVPTATLFISLPLVNNSLLAAISDESMRVGMVMQRCSVSARHD